jgi:hypothetical protein
VRSVFSNTNAVTFCNNLVLLFLNDCGGIIYFGNGTDAMRLLMNTNLNLSCLGAIRFV